MQKKVVEISQKEASEQTYDSFATEWIVSLVILSTVTVLSVNWSFVFTIFVDNCDKKFFTTNTINKNSLCLILFFFSINVYVNAVSALCCKITV